MSSILVGELKTILEDVPDDYEVIMEYDEKTIAFINGVKVDDEWREVRLMS